MEQAYGMLKKEKVSVKFKEKGDLKKVEAIFLKRGSVVWCGKRYSKIDQHLARNFKYNGASLSMPPPFIWSNKTTPFSNSIISANQETGL